MLAKSEHTCTPAPLACRASHGVVLQLLPRTMAMKDIALSSFFMRPSRAQGQTSWRPARQQVFWKLDARHAMNTEIDAAAPVSDCENSLRHPASRPPLKVGKE